MGIAEALPVYLNDELPVWLGFIDKLRASHGGPYMVGAEITLADYVAFECLDGNIRAGGWQILDAYPGLQQFVRMFANRPNIKKYLQSEGQQTGKARLAFTLGQTHLRNLELVLTISQ